MKIKTFIGNYDGLRQGLVIASTKREAAQAIEWSTKDFRDYWDETITSWSFRDLKHKTLYTRANNNPSGTWVEGRCKLPTKKKGEE